MGRRTVTRELANGKGLEDSIELQLLVDVLVTGRSIDSWQGSAGGDAREGDVSYVY
jgi:hypothetical protein